MKTYIKPRVNHPVPAQWYLAKAIMYWHLYTPEETEQIQQGLEILSDWLRPHIQIKMIREKF